MSQNSWTLNLPWRALFKLSLLLVLIIAANLVSHWITGLLRFEILPSNEDFVHHLIMTAAVAYAVLLAIPFVPGIEIGLALISMFGPPIVFLVYVSTVVGLSLAYVAGRLIPLNGLVRWLDEFGLHRVSRLLDSVEPMSKDERLNFLVAKAPTRFVPFLLRHRYLALAVMFNLPGNFLVGGGGGIAMIAGVSGIYSAAGFLVTVMFAVSPVPIAILIFGARILS